MFWHRFFGNHKWNTIKEKDIPPTTNLVKATGDPDYILKLSKGYRITIQECEICGDRRVLHEF